MRLPRGASPARRGFVASRLRLAIEVIKVLIRITRFKLVFVFFDELPALPTVCLGTEKRYAENSRSHVGPVLTRVVSAPGRGLNQRSLVCCTRSTKPTNP